MYLVTTEDYDGIWYDEPNVFSSEADARMWARTKSAAPPKGHALVLYRCHQIATLAESN